MTGYDWRTGLELEGDHDAIVAAQLDRDAVVVENLRLQAEVQRLELDLERERASLRRLSSRLVDAERQALRAPVTRLAELEILAAAAEVRAVATERALEMAEAAQRRAETELGALQSTRTLRYMARPREAYGRVRRLIARR